MKQELTGKQRRHLKGLAHHLSPVVQVGKDGLTPEVEAAVREALLTHELIKVKVLEGAPVERTEVGPALAAAVSAHEVGTIGRVVMLYKRHPNKPTIVLPKASA